jgi:acyl-CoA-binding protein
MDNDNKNAMSTPQPVQERFNTAVEFIKNLPPSTPESPAMSNEDKLKFYALYKQATQGEKPLSSKKKGKKSGFFQKKISPL